MRRGKAGNPIGAKRRAEKRVLDSEEVLAEGVSELRRIDPVMARILAEGALPTLRKRAPGFHGLAWIIMGQQLSVASADAIWTRLVSKLGPLTPAAIHAASDDTLKSCGLSGPKIRTLRGAADAIAAGTLALDDLINMPAETAHSALTALKGVGPWTADIYLMFCLGHCDAFAAGRSRAAGGRAARLWPSRPTDRTGTDSACGTLAPVASGGRQGALGLLQARQRACRNLRRGGSRPPTFARRQEAAPPRRQRLNVASIAHRTTVWPLASGSGAAASDQPCRRRLRFPPYVNETGTLPEKKSSE